MHKNLNHINTHPLVISNCSTISIESRGTIFQSEL